MVKIMKILKQNLRKGVMTLKIESYDDLWHLKHVIEQGDLITSKTLRRRAIKSGGEIKLGEREPVVLTLEVEKIEFQRDILRATGKIRKGPEKIQLASYHTIQIKPGTILKVQKEWKKHQITRIKKAQIKQPLLFLCLIDREQADFAILKESGIEFLGSIKCKGEEEREKYYENIMENLERQSFLIIVAGPGFERENLFNFVKEKNPKLADNIILEHASYIGMPGIKEVVKTSANKILKETRIARETNLVEELLKRIKTDGLVVYGKKETLQAVNLGAVDTLLISLEKIPEFEKLMEQAEKFGGKVSIISSDHELGEQFLHLGGVAGFLRFRINT